MSAEGREAKEVSWRPKRGEEGKKKNEQDHESFHGRLTSSFELREGNATTSRLDHNEDLVLRHLDLLDWESDRLVLTELLVSRSFRTSKSDFLEPADEERGEVVRSRYRARK